MATEAEPNDRANQATSIGTLSLQGGGSVNLVIIGEMLGDGDTVDWFSFSHFPSLETVNVSVKPLILFNSRLDDGGVNGETQKVVITPKTGLSGDAVGFLIKTGYDAYKNDLNKLIAEVDVIKAAMQQAINAGESSPGFWAEVGMYNQLTALAGQILELNGTNTDPRELADQIRDYLRSEPNRGGGFDSQLDSVYKRMAALFDKWEKPRVYDLDNRLVTDMAIGEDWTVSGETKARFAVTGSHALTHHKGTQGGTSVETVGFNVASIDILATRDGKYGYVGGTSGNDRRTLTSRNETMDAGGGNDSIDGAGGHDSLNGGKGTDTLKGGKGNDTLIGGSGIDNLDGGDGRDLLVLGKDADKARGGGGIDTMTSSITRDLGKFSDIENLTLLGTADADGKGNALDNHIIGNGGDNELDGAGGRNTLNGGDGDDTYHLGSRTTETIIDSSGNDTITSTISRTLASFTGIENIILLGSGNRNATGDDGDNLLVGNSGNNRLDGGIGEDTLRGGGGNDTYRIQNDDTVEDSGGTDTIISEYSLSLEDFDGIENLTMLIGAFRAWGTGGANVITAPETNVEVDGKGGDDTLIGGDGGDTLIGNAGADSIVGGNGEDRLFGDGTDEGHLAAGDGTADLSKTVGTIYSLLGGPATILLDSGFNFDDFPDLTVTRAATGAGVHTYAIFLSEGDWVTFDIGDTNGFDSELYFYGPEGVGQIEYNDNDPFEAGGPDQTDSRVGSWRADVAGLYIVKVGRSTGDNDLQAGDSYKLDLTMSRANYVQRVDAASGGKDTLLGGAGDDYLDGGRGADLLIGGTGLDTLFGGSGPDRFVFQSVADSAPGEADLIGDFQAGGDADKIDLSAVYSGTLHLGEVWSTGELSFSSQGEIRVAIYSGGTYRIFIETDGNLSTADMEIRVMGTPNWTNLGPSASDFIL
jgi:Ca2+-binding RTX toxin-like protein